MSEGDVLLNRLELLGLSEVFDKCLWRLCRIVEILMLNKLSSRALTEYLLEIKHSIFTMFAII